MRARSPTGEMTLTDQIEPLALEPDQLRPAGDDRDRCRGRRGGADAAPRRGLRRLTRPGLCRAAPADHSADAWTAGPAYGLRRAGRPIVSSAESPWWRRRRCHRRDRALPGASVDSGRRTAPTAANAGWWLAPPIAAMFMTTCSLPWFTYTDHRLRMNPAKPSCAHSHLPPTHVFDWRPTVGSTMSASSARLPVSTWGTARSRRSIPGATPSFRSPIRSPHRTDMCGPAVSWAWSR